MDLEITDFDIYDDILVTYDTLSSSLITFAVENKWESISTIKVEAAETEIYAMKENENDLDTYANWYGENYVIVKQDAKLV